MFSYLKITAFTLLAPIFTFLSDCFIFIFEFTLFTDIIAVS